MRMKMWLNGVCKRVLTSACGAWPGLLSRFEKAVWHVRFGAWRKQQTATIVEWREPVFERLLQSGDADGPIDYLEYGVFEGKTLRWWVNRNRDPASRSSALIRLQVFRPTGNGHPKASFRHRVNCPYSMTRVVDWWSASFRTRSRPFLLRTNWNEERLSIWMQISTVRPSLS